MSVTHDEVTAMLGGVKLQMVLGDIVQESTDAIINTTDFSDNPAGMIDFLKVMIYTYHTFLEFCVCYIHFC